MDKKDFDLNDILNEYDPESAVEETEVPSSRPMQPANEKIRQAERRNGRIFRIMIDPFLIYG